MNSPLHIQDYIQSHEKFRKDLNALHFLLENLELKTVIQDGEPVYLKENSVILGFRVFENYYMIWFQNEMINPNSLDLKTISKLNGVLPLHFDLENKLNKDLVKNQVLAAIHRIELEQRLKIDFKDSEFINFTEFLKNSSLENQMFYPEFLIHVIKTTFENQSKSEVNPDIKNKNV